MIIFHNYHAHFAYFRNYHAYFAHIQCVYIPIIVTPANPKAIPNLVLTAVTLCTSQGFAVNVTVFNQMKVALLWAPSSLPLSQHAISLIICSEFVQPNDFPRCTSSLHQHPYTSLDHGQRTHPLRCAGV